MRRAGLLFVFAILATAIAPWNAHAEGRSILVGATLGARSFEDRLDLSSEAAVGLRMGLGLNEHVSVLMDVNYTTPTRATTGRLARVTSLRSLVQYRYIAGPVHPYLLGGVGGVLFDFDDTYDAAGGTFTGGGGIEFRLARQVTVFGEATLDWYRSRSVTYAPTGEQLTIGKRNTDEVRTIMAGLLARF